MTTTEIEEIKAEICDEYCKYPSECRCQFIQDKICSKCPLNRLEGEDGEQT